MSVGRFHTFVCSAVLGLVAISWLFAGSVAIAAAPAGPHVVFVIGEEGYQTGRTLPEFAKREPVNRVLVNAVHWCLKRQVPGAATATANAPRERDKYKTDLAGNEQVEQIIRTFEGKGEIGDDSKPTPPEQAVNQLRVQSGFEVELLAHEPTIRQPLQMSWDHRGRLWVVQYLQYPFPAGLKVIKYDQYLRAVFDKVPPPPPHHFPGADKISVLEDTDGDGRFDTAKDVITGLNIVSAVTT
ncbi:MAG: hypothetical protein HY000_02940, partial [Planctomycetes bacterium]|nr:hypothetical protein [Planctomycetota bacterium]